MVNDSDTQDLSAADLLDRYTADRAGYAEYINNEIARYQAEIDELDRKREAKQQRETLERLSKQSSLNFLRDSTNRISDRWRSQIFANIK